MNKQKMYMRMITASLMRRRGRMVVALLAVVVGATILSGLVTIYNDVPRQLGAQFRSYGANLILTPGADSDGMTQDDIDKATAIVPSEQLVGLTPYHYESLYLNNLSIVVASTDLASVQRTSPYWYVNGEWPQASGEILVGLEEAETFGLNVGDKVTIAYASNDDGTVSSGAAVVADNTMDFTVTGVLDTGGNEEQYFFISNPDMAQLIMSDVAFDVTELSIQATSEELSTYADRIAAEVPAVTPQLVKRVTESETAVLSKLQTLVLLVTIVVLALTMICVATTMTAVVTERRKEIGLRKALGASNKSITLEFMGEGMLLGAFGGLIGAGLGFAFAQAVSTNVFNSSISFQPLLLPATLIAAVAISALACILPVRNATKVDPALVLKGE